MRVSHIHMTFLVLLNNICVIIYIVYLLTSYTSHVYSDDHQLTACAKRNLEYVKNKRRSLAGRPLAENVHVAT